jgi:hypothetical protein
MNVGFEILKKMATTKLWLRLWISASSPSTPQHLILYKQVGWGNSFG